MTGDSRDVETFGLEQLAAAGVGEGAAADAGGLVHLWAVSWADEVELLRMLGLLPCGGGSRRRFYRYGQVVRP